MVEGTMGMNDSEARPVRAEVIDDRKQAVELAKLRGLAQLMDDAFEIPGTGWRIGLDGIIGLVPGIGDLIGFAVSAYIVVMATQFRLSKVVIARMLLNIAVEGVVGAIPFFGDVFDFAWKANRKNIILIEQALTAPAATRRKSAGTLGLVIGGIIVIGALVIWAVVMAVGALIGMLAGR